MRFFISRPNNIVSVDNAAAEVDCSSLDPSVGYVVWNENGSGFVEPAEGVPLRLPFSDPSPYQGLINLWIAAQGAITTPQAKAVKNGLVGAIYLVKSQAPVAVTVGAGTLSWDATPDAILTLVGYVGTEYIDPVNTAITKLNALIGAVDSLINFMGTLSSEIGSNDNAIVSDVNSLVAALNVIGSSDPFATAGLTFSVSGFSGLSNPSTAGVPATITTTPGLTVPSFSVLPHGALATVTVSPTEVQSILTAISTQRVAKQLISSMKQAAVNALPNVPSVIAYDATTGW